jgi:hypothetical protein
MKYPCTPSIRIYVWVKLNKEKERGEWFSGGSSAKAGLNKREAKTDLEGRNAVSTKLLTKRKVKRERGTQMKAEMVTAE